VVFGGALRCLVCKKRKTRRSGLDTFAFFCTSDVAASPKAGRREIERTITAVLGTVRT
jgi:hypothetical protein